MPRKESELWFSNNRFFSRYRFVFMTNNILVQMHLRQFKFNMSSKIKRQFDPIVGEKYVFDLIFMCRKCCIII